jgi:hypothetical protein
MLGKTFRMGVSVMPFLRDPVFSGRGNLAFGFVFFPSLSVGWIAASLALLAKKLGLRQSGAPIKVKQCYVTSGR